MSAQSSPQSQPRRVRIHHIAQAKAEGTPLTMLTAYDALTAPLLEEAGVDMLLVGDSLGNVVLGHSSTLNVTVEDMERATSAVAHSVRRPLVVADLPFGTYEASPEQAFESAARLMRAGAHAVKLEGGSPRVDAIRMLIEGGIPVVGHLGYTPQSDHLLGGPRIQGRGAQAERLLADAHALDQAGVFALVLEMVPDDIATRITREVSTATIGIGAGPHTDGQVLVWSDMAGMSSWVPSFVRRFGEVGAEITNAARAYVDAVREGSFPAEGNYHAE